MKTPRLFGYFIAFALALLLTGCETTSATPAAPINYGTPPMTPNGPDHVPEIVRAFMEMRLKDAASAQYKFPETIQATTLKAGLLSGKQSLHAWRADVWINAKNSIGAYIGYKLHIFLIRDGRVVAYNSSGNAALNIWETP